MLSNRARLSLTDICDNMRLAEDFAAGLSVEGPKADRRTLCAETRCLEIISEATRRLSQSLRNRHPDLLWRAIMGAGNVYRHEYDNVAEAIVWGTVQHNLVPRALRGKRFEPMTELAFRDRGGLASRPFRGHDEAAAERRECGFE